MDADSALNLLAADPNAEVDIVALALHLSRDEYPFLDVDAYLNELAGLVSDAKEYLGTSLASQVAGLSRVLHHEAGFRGNTHDYYDPRNSYLNEVIDRRTGIPLTLSMIAIWVGKRLGMHVHGLALPGHFIAAARQGNERILFDPFNAGRVLTLEDCAAMITESAGLEVPILPQMLEPAATGTIVTRLLMNLKGSYLRCKDYRRAARTIRRLRQIRPGDFALTRDLGACLLNAGLPGKAIDALTEYLEQKPEMDDSADVRKLLSRARSEQARWN